MKTSELRPRIHALIIDAVADAGFPAAVFRRDTMTALSIAKRIESGICQISEPTVRNEGQMPFGGLKGSGFGWFGGSRGDQ